ncbi:TPA: hypothetical protein R1718_001689 [Campylobacter lari]|nr:hypothetical protein [Campylobacter lari]EIE4560399.1 hypothetical protein [Campylobacter lari]EIE4566741.1 hypothetical protein [Campylobacter lari]EIE4610105.1 hypothetical protein [Campylobacter lari]HEC1790106.1 hypothetical protein [Campylobacter lari]
MNLYLYILNLNIFEYFVLFLIVLMGFAILFNAFDNKVKIKEKGVLGAFDMLVSFTICLTAIIAILFLANPITHFIFSEKANNSYKKYLSEKNIRKDTIDDLTKLATLGFGHCERNNYKSETCVEYLRYLENIIKKIELEKTAEDIARNTTKTLENKIRLEKENKENILKESIEKYIAK